MVKYVSLAFCVVLNQKLIIVNLGQGFKKSSEKSRFSQFPKIETKIEHCRKKSKFSQKIETKIEHCRKNRNFPKKNRNFPKKSKAKFDQIVFQFSTPISKL